MEEILAVLKAIPVLDASLYGIAVISAIGLRLLRASVEWVGKGHSILVAAIFGALGGGLQLSMGSHPWQFVVLQCLALSVGIALLDPLLGKLPIFPNDNELVNKNKGE